MLTKKQIPLIYLLLTAAAIVAFWQVSQCDFIHYDDPLYVSENIHIRDGISMQAIRWALTTCYAGNWHPLTWMSHMLDVQLYGLNPRWHHLTNLLFHIANTLLLFFVFHRMTKAPWKSAFVAALFTIHPLHVESVAWVSERKDVLSTFFWMLTMGAYINYVEHGTEDRRQRSEDRERRSEDRERRTEDRERRTEDGRQSREDGSSFSVIRFPSSVFRYLAVLIFFVLGLMAKPMLVTLPFVLLLLDYWPLQRLDQKKPALQTRTEASQQGAESREREPLSVKNRKGKSGKMRTGQGMVKEEEPVAHKYQWALVRPLLLEKIPLLVLAALSCIVTYAAQQKGGAVKSIESFPLGVRVANAFVSYIIYIGKTVWPSNLAVLYPHPGLWPLWQVLGAVLLLGAVTLMVIRTAKRFPYLAMGWLWFLGTLVPVIGIVQVGDQAMADRYTYIPLIGLFVMAAWGIPELLRNWQPSRPPRKEALFALPALILPCLLIVTWTQVGYWRNSITLFEHALKVTNGNYLIHNNRGNVFIGLGNLTQGIEDFDRAIEIKPKYAHAYNNRGAAYDRLGNHRQAISDYDRAIEVDPEYATAYYNRGVAYDRLGNHRQAISDYDRAIEINPEYAEAYINRGVTYDELGNQRQAISDYDRAIGIDPENADAYNNRAIAHGKLGNYWQAIEDCDRAIGINPRHAGAFYNRGVAHYNLGNLRNAFEDMKTAANLGNEDAKNNLRNAGINW
ncbi:MAG: tetratricopeptide repeat protein [Syntrophobacteraceae bacterium]